MEVNWVQALGLEGMARSACGHWIRHRLVLLLSVIFGLFRKGKCCRTLSHQVAQPQQPPTGIGLPASHPGHLKQRQTGGIGLGHTGHLVVP